MGGERMGVAALSGRRKVAHAVLPLLPELTALQRHLEVTLDHTRGGTGHPQPGSLRRILHRVRGGGSASDGEPQRTTSGVRGHQRAGLPCLHLPHTPRPS
ncbi:hypothetical protein E2C01_088964 [Portunus trituberculatus]|uniref:Uncharacterized protein n=1 Tax=Portunus trituberculatus TaxID=210409 RepID=A0A5B7JG16_PORTR|nr:hypothetical protein [Portunus trituberculatus]